MNATEAVTVIKLLLKQLESTSQTDPAASVLQSVIDHLGREVRAMTEPEPDDGGPAFPWGEHGTRLGGATLRDIFAASAPEVPIDFDWQNGETDLMQRLIRWRWHYADQMLKARRS